MDLTKLGFVKNRTSGKAVAGIQAVYFLSHENGEEPNMMDKFKLPGSKEWFPVLTRRDSVVTAQDDPNIEEIHVDQFDAPIGITVEPGNFNFEAILPSLKKDDLKMLFGANVEEITDGDEDVTIDGLELLGINLSGEVRSMSVLLVTKTGALLAYSNVQMTFTFQKDDKLFTVKASGRILAPENENNKMLYIATEPKKYDVTELTLPSTKSVNVGDDIDLTGETGFKVTPAGAKASLKWSSNDNTVATVTAEGVVTGIAAGNAVIKVTTADGAKSATCNVTVKTVSA